MFFIHHPLQVSVLGHRSFNSVLYLSLSVFEMQS